MWKSLRTALLCIKVRIDILAGTEWAKQHNIFSPLPPWMQVTMVIVVLAEQILFFLELHTQKRQLPMSTLRGGPSRPGMRSLVASAARGPRLYLDMVQKQRPNKQQQVSMVNIERRVYLDSRKSMYLSITTWPESSFTGVHRYFLSVLCIESCMYISKPICLAVKSVIVILLKHLRNNVIALCTDWQ